MTRHKNPNPRQFSSDNYDGIINGRIDQIVADIQDLIKISKESE